MRRDANLKNTIAIFTGTADVFTNPTLVSFFELLQNENIDILLFSYDQLIPPPAYFKNITYFFLPPIISKSKGLKDGITSFKINIKTIAVLKKYQVTKLFGVDYYGFIVASRFKRFLPHSSLGYFSFELLFADEITEKKYLAFKKKEIRQVKKMDYLIIQDDTRLGLFLKENNLQKANHFKTFKIPVAPKRIDMSKVEGINLHEKLNIPKEKKILVYSGSVGDWAGADQLLELLENNWNDKFWLIIHSRLPLTPENEYSIRINKLIEKGYPVTLHANPFDNYLEYAAFLKNADAAIVLYKSKEGSMYFGKNIKEIGLASGKFSMYLMLGIPVLTSSQTTYKELLKNYNFGGVIEENQAFPKLLEICYNQKEVLKKNTAELYDKLLDPEKQLRSLIEQFN